MSRPPRTGFTHLAAVVLAMPSCVLDLGDLSGGKGDAGTTGTATGAGGGAPVTAAQIQGLLQTCKQVPGSTDFESAPGKPNDVPICTLNGAVWWTSAMSIACDGGKGAACMSAPGYSSGTAGTDSKGQPLDASTLPFVVVPQPSDGFDWTTAGLSFGSVAAVLYKDKLAYAIVGDLGDEDIAGEGSYALAQALGIDPDPSTGGVATGVSYVLFTGATGVVQHNEDHAEAEQLGEALAARLMQSN